MAIFTLKSENLIIEKLICSTGCRCHQN